ncbi:hypothetical protein ACIBEH_29390 [Nocardia salmonicida]|uniref:Rv0361 family membrane protein n=1 Tax=Nocardia salmonicida TaxID=53431 RepID=UPI0037BB94EA
MGRPGEQGPEQDSAGAGSPLAGLSKGLPGKNQGGKPDAPSSAPPAERDADLAGPDAPTTAMSIPGRSPAGGRGSADDRTVKIGGDQAKSAQADVPTAAMSRADLTIDPPEETDDNASAPSDESELGSVAAAAGGVAAGAAVAAGGSDSDEASEASKPTADGARAQDGDTTPSAIDKAAVEADSKESETAPGAAPAAEPENDPAVASPGEPEAESSGSETADSRDDKPVDVEATEKFSTSKPTGNASSEDRTVSMKVASADSPTTAMPVQRPKTAGPGGTDRVVPPAGGRPAMTPPPNTPRGPAGPRQAGQPAPGQLGPAGPGQSPAGPGQHGPVGPGGQQGPPRGPQQGPVDPRPNGPGQQAPVGAGQPGLGQQGPTGPGPQGSRGAEQLGVEETQPSPPRGPGAPQRTGGSAPSPADIQPTRPAQQLAEGQRQVAPPQRIGAQGEAPAEPGAKQSKKWLLAAGGAAVLVVALIATVVALMGGTDDSPEGQVKAVIGDYTDALRSGDLEDLRASTCGELHTFYQGITAEQFKGVHEVSTERGSIPVVDSVDAVRITGDTALAQATVYTSADPSKRTARTFDLQRTDGSWKVCDPAGTP